MSETEDKLALLSSKTELENINVSLYSTILERVLDVLCTMSEKNKIQIYTIYVSLLIQSLLSLGQVFKSVVSV